MKSERKKERGCRRQKLKRDEETHESIERGYRDWKEGE
jgi:hypothetical protein